MNKVIQKIPNLGLAILAGILLWAAWPPSPLFPLIFVALVPLFILEKRIREGTGKRKGWRFFGLVFLALLIWNVLTTYWIWFATASAGAGPAASGAWVLNALFQSLPWIGYHRLRRRFSPRLAFLGLISFWLAFEFIHFQWELAWPWLTMGNVFAKFPQLIQWYEITGVSGGTLWVLIANIFLFIYPFNPNCNSKPWRIWALGAFLIGLPMLLSIIRFNAYNIKGNDIKVTVVQPNIDPYEEQQTNIDIEEVQDTMFNLALEQAQPDTDYIVFPETSIPEFTWLAQLENTGTVIKLKRLTEKAPNARIIIGADLFENYGNEKKTITARYSERAQIYYDVYNAALELSPGNASSVYAKSKLVPGVERMPYPKYLRFLENIVIDLGGASGTRATQKERTVFTGGKTQVAPAICYESVFGDYLKEFVQNGAKVIFIITNDGWWKDTPGYKQHLYYASLRAIENRRSVARSANTGVSAFINQKGIIEQRSQWWVETALTDTIKANDQLTFFTKHGDYLGRIGLLLSFALILISLVKRFTGGFKYA